MGEFAVYCNVRAPHRYMRFGALCLIANLNPGWGGEHVEVIGLSRGGRKVRTWMDARDLNNYRAKWCPETEGLVRRDKADCEKWAAALSRFANTPMRDMRPKEARDKSQELAQNEATPVAGAM